MRFWKRKSVKGIFKGIGITVAGATLFGIINLATIGCVSVTNKLPKPEKKTIVFTYFDIESDERVYVTPKFGSKALDFFMYTPITLAQNLKGNRVEWYSNPSYDTFVKKIRNPNYKNIVLIGHGGDSSYSLSDCSISSEDIEKLKIKKRTGEFLQYTCRQGEGGNIEDEEGNDAEKKEKLESLEGVLFDECTRVKKFDGTLWPHVAYVSAWKDVVIRD